MKKNNFYNNYVLKIDKDKEYYRSTKTMIKNKEQQENINTFVHTVFYDKLVDRKVQYIINWYKVYCTLYDVECYDVPTLISTICDIYDLTLRGDKLC